MKPYILKRESVYICTDRKTYAELIEQYLLEFLINEENKKKGKDKDIKKQIEKIKEYFMLFTKNKGTLSEIQNCNETFMNKCVITSPKMTFGVSIDEIKYKETFAVYSGQTIDSQTMVQQIGRARSTKKVSVIFVKNHTKKNKYISYEKNEELEITSLNDFKKIKSNVFKVIDDLCLKRNHKEIKFDTESYFKDIHMYAS